MLSIFDEILTFEKNEKLSGDLQLLIGRFERFVVLIWTTWILWRYTIFLPSGKQEPTNSSKVEFL